MSRSPAGLRVLLLGALPSEPAEPLAQLGIADEPRQRCRRGCRRCRPRSAARSRRRPRPRSGPQLPTRRPAARRPSPRAPRAACPPSGSKGRRRRTRRGRDARPAPRRRARPPRRRRARRSAPRAGRATGRRRIPGACALPGASRAIAAISVEKSFGSASRPTLMISTGSLRPACAARRGVPSTSTPFAITIDRAAVQVRAARPARNSVCETQMTMVVSGRRSGRPRDRPARRRRSSP